jgi:hypothetical protein
MNICQELFPKSFSCLEKSVGSRFAIGIAEPERELSQLAADSITPTAANGSQSALLANQGTTEKSAVFTPGPVG